MPYYQGDYVGGYGMGDPGFFSILGRAVGFGRKLLGLGGAKKAIEAEVVRPGMGGAIQRVGQRVMALPPLAKAGIVLGGAAAVQRVMGGAGARGLLGAGERARKGFHISKKTGKEVRNRRMRVTNPRALRRAIRRAHGFARLARRVLHFTSPRAARGRAIFKKHRRRAA